MAELTKPQLKQLRQLLLNLEQTLTETLSLNEASADTVALDQTKVGRLSRMDAMQQQAMAKASRSGTQQRLTRVRQALVAMEQDDYGYCECCGNGIGFARLSVKPESTLCVSCQHQNEQRSQPF